MDTGPDRVRNKMRITPRTFSVKWTMSNAVYRAFDIWFNDTVKGGLLEFDIQLLDDTETLVWFTCTFLDRTYQADIVEDDKWLVTCTLLSVKDPFDTRPSGTDELQGLANLQGFRASAQMLIATTLHGKATFTMQNQAKFNYAPFYGKSTFFFSGRGRLTPRPFYGLAVFTGFRATAQPQVFGDPELILQFDAVTYTPPTGDVVELQFDSTVYYPPHII